MLNINEHFLNKNRFSSFSPSGGVDLGRVLRLPGPRDGHPVPRRQDRRVQVRQAMRAKGLPRRPRIRDHAHGRDGNARLRSLPGAGRH